MKLPLQRIVFIFTTLFSSILLQAQIPWSQNEPVFGDPVHDPTIYRDEDGRYTLMSTNNRLLVKQSFDLVNWTNHGRVFNVIPQWIKNIAPGLGDLWAPHITKMGGRYYAYYCGSEFGTNTSAIGCAVSNSLDPNSPNYGWTDLGMVIESRGQNFNAIDPEIIQAEDGKWYMMFGSFWQTGIRLVEINPNTGKRTSSNNTIYALADRNGGAIEGPSIIFHDGYYYLFVAYDKCCDGANSTYRTMVGRSQSITGPYRDKNGNDMRDNAATEVLSKYDKYAGTGHGSVFKDNKRDYFVHHYYESTGYPRAHIRQIVYGTDGWPILTQPFMGRRQSFEAEHAKITNAVWNTGNGASNNSYIGYINYPDTRVRFDIDALQGGTYNLRIRYAAGDGAASHFLSVNGQEQEVQYPATANWGQFPQGQTVTVPVTLKKGYNSLVFRLGTGFAELDRVDLMRPTANVIEIGSVDDGVGLTFNGDNNATLKSGSWAKIEYVDFGNGGFNAVTIKAAGNASGSLKISIDGRNGSTNATATLNLTAGQSYQLSLPNSFSALKNEHDVYIEYTGSGNASLDEMLFGKGIIPPVDCNGDAFGTASLDDCGVCVGGNSSNLSCTGSLEAEEVCDVDGFDSETTNAGFSGTGYVNTTNAIGAYASWGVNSTSAQTATISFRYANGGTTSRDGSISIEGANVGNIVLPPTGAWTTWQTASVNIQLKNGYNEIVVTATTDDGLANIDKVSFSSGVTDAQCGLITAIGTNDLQTISVYPSPTTGILTIKTTQEVSWKLYNQLGQEIQKGESRQLDVSKEVKGIYLLQVGNQLFKILKQ